MADLQGTGYASPRWSWEILDCAMPMTFDTYSNCAFQCVYCFAFFQRAIGQGGDDYKHHKVESVNVQSVKELFLGKKPNSQFNGYIKNKFVLQWGGLSDGFDWYERKFGKSLELLQFFNSIDYPISISTKGCWMVDPSRPESAPYREAFKGAKNIHVKSSVITLDETLSRRVEPGTATSEERFKMLEEMNKLGVGGTTVRFRPFILGVSADYPYTENSRKQIDTYLKRCADAGVYSVTSEFLCLESRSKNIARERYQAIGEASGFPGDSLYQFYFDNSVSKTSLLRLNYDVKRPYFEDFIELAHKHGLKAFISDAHHKEKSDGAGCCGLPNEGPLSKYNKGQFAEAILIAKQNGKVHWKDIATAATWLKDITMKGADTHGFNSGGTQERAKRTFMTMFDYMNEQWNKTNSLNSPARYFGGALSPAPEKDEEGNVVYIYNEPYIKDAKRMESAKDIQLEMVSRGYKMQEAGEDWGYVASPVFVDARNMGASEVGVSKLMTANRLNHVICVYPAQVEEFRNAFPDVEVSEVMGEVWQDLYFSSDYRAAWIVPGSTVFTDDKGVSVTPRKYLSFAEDCTERNVPFVGYGQTGVKHISLEERSKV